MNPLDFLLGKTKPSPRGSVPGFPPAPRGRFPSSWGVPKAPVSAVPKGGAGTLLFNPITAAYSIPGYSEQKTRNAAGVIEGTRGPLNELQYIGGQLLRGRMPYSKPLNAIETGKYGPTDWNPSANPTASMSSVDPANRAYQKAKAETAAMVATDPMMQQWEAARQAKDYATADQLGKQIWQNTYGQKPIGQPGGVIGSRNPLMQSTFGYQTGMSPGDIAQTITNPAAVPVGPGEAPYQMGDLGTGALAETGYDPTRYGVDVEEIKKRLLQQAAAK